MIASINLCNTDIIIGTDQNIDYGKVNNDHNASDLLDMFFTEGVLPTIKRSTRITHTSSTVIDNIYVKCDGYLNVDSRILISQMSDHFPIIACLGKSCKSTSSAKEPLVFYHRPIEQYTSYHCEHGTGRLG